MAKALVTGAAGFIGSHLAEALLRRGHQVVLVDDLSGSSRDNLAWMQGHPEVRFVEGDAANASLMQPLLEGCDWVFHEAALPSVPRSISEPLESHAANLTVTLALLEQARAAAVRRFVFASSSAIYGDNPASPKHEALSAQPLSPYGLQKHASEVYAAIYHQLHGLETVALRYFNVFGPRQSFDSPYSGVIARFATAALSGQGVTIFGDGKQTRDFTYVANVVEANILAAEGPKDAVAGRVFNVGAGVSVSLLELVGAIGELTGRTIPVHLEPSRAGDIRHSAADTTAFRKATGYEPAIDWREGLRRTLEWYQA